MTLPFERTRAVLQTRDFLMDLADRKKTPRVPLVIRRQALSLLRHYPNRFEMETVCENEKASQMHSIYRVFAKSFDE